MTATSTVRTATELRLVELLGELPGWSTTPDLPGTWWVAPWGRGRPQSRRSVVVGVPEGSSQPDAIAGQVSSTTDVWTTTIWILCSDIDDGPDAKQAVEDIVNEIADLIAANPRLDMNPGPRSGILGSWEGPFFEENDGLAICTAEIEITWTADIWRDPT